MTEDELTPTQELIMEVLAARTRLGEHFWTFGRRPAIVMAAKQLESVGLVFLRSGQVERTFQAGLTESGKKMVLHDPYVPPILRGKEKRIMTDEQRLMSKILADRDWTRRVVAAAVLAHKQINHSPSYDDGVRSARHMLTESFVDLAGLDAAMSAL